jgi:hypothetical protein
VGFAVLPAVGDVAVGESVDDPAALAGGVEEVFVFQLGEVAAEDFRVDRECGGEVADAGRAVPLMGRAVR